MKRWTWITVLVLLFIHSIATFAQQQERKVVRKVAPSYPEFARRVSLNGTVNSPWQNCSCFVTWDEACGNGAMIRGADQRRQ
jgi:hypothetical protein